MSLSSRLDSAISLLSPGWAARRQAARLRLDAMATMAQVYEAARPSRDGGGFHRSSGPADDAIGASQGAMLARARAAMRDTKQGASIRAAAERNVVGVGITPMWRARTATGQLNRAFNRNMREVYRRWSESPEHCDVEKKLTFAGIQRRAVGELIEAGEHFVVWSLVASDQVPGLRLQCFEPEQLDMSRTAMTAGANEIRGGIEIDQFGAAVAYHFRRHRISQFGIGSEDSIRIPARRVCHLMDVKRVQQSHGVTRMHAVLNRLANTNQYEYATLMAAMMEACVGLIDKSDAGSLGVGVEAGIGASAETTAGDPLVEFAPGMVAKGDFDFIDPKRPGNRFEPFITHQDRSIAAGADLSYEVVTRDFSKGTYSSQRQTMLEDWKSFDIVEEILRVCVLDPIARQLTTSAAREAFVAAPGFERDPGRFTRVDWQGPPRQWVDPKNEAQAAETSIRAGTNTLTRVLGRLGSTPEETFDELAEELDMAEQRGLQLSVHQSAPAAQATPAAGSGDDGDEQEDDE